MQAYLAVWRPGGYCFAGSLLNFFKDSETRKSSGFIGFHPQRHCLRQHEFKVSVGSIV